MTTAGATDEEIEIKTLRGMVETLTKENAELKGGPMKQFDLKSHVEFHLANNKGNTFLDMFGGQVAEELQKTTIETELKTRSHKFDDGEGEVADELLIRVKFNDAVVQPHVDFEDDFASQVAIALEENINGLLENSDDGSAE